MGIIASSVFAGSIAFGAVFLMVYFFRKKRIAAINNDGENGRMIIDSPRMNNSLPLGTNRGGGVDIFLEDHLVFRGTEGGQSTPTECKRRGYRNNQLTAYELPMRGGRSKEYFRALWEDQVNFIPTQVLQPGINII